MLSVSPVVFFTGKGLNLTIADDQRLIDKPDVAYPISRFKNDKVENLNEGANKILAVGSGQSEAN
jgi:hypothetical protein